MANDLQQFENVPAYSAGQLPQKTAEKGVFQAQNEYFTAMKVQVPRDLDQIYINCLKEAKKAQERFYYILPWGNPPIQGPSIGLAKSVAREFGNCVIKTKVESRVNSWVFESFFIDLEKGFCTSKLFRQPKQLDLGRISEDKERAKTIAFQIGQSKAYRNVVLLAMPEWLIEDTVFEAKKNLLMQCSGEGATHSIKLATEFFEGYGIFKTDLEKYIGCKEKDWKARDIQRLREIVSAVKQNMMNATDIKEEGEKQSEKEAKKQPKVPADKIEIAPKTSEPVQPPPLPPVQEEEQKNVTPDPEKEVDKLMLSEKGAKEKLAKLEMQEPELTTRLKKVLGKKPASIIVREIEKSLEIRNARISKQPEQITI